MSDSTVYDVVPDLQYIPCRTADSLGPIIRGDRDQPPQRRDGGSSLVAQRSRLDLQPPTTNIPPFTIVSSSQVDCTVGLPEETILFLSAPII
jgi:hypothetical protein